MNGKRMAYLWAWVQISALCVLCITLSLGSIARAERPKVLRYIGPALSTLNSYLYTGGMYAQVTLGTKEGLVQLGPDGRSLVPAQADRWEVSEDAMTYTFYLRKDNVWYDGTPVTAWDYKAAFIHQLEPGQQSKFTWDTPLPYVERVLDFRNGAARAEEVGIDVLDDYTIRFRLGLAYPAFMNAMITGSMFPIHRGSLEKHGEDWHKPEHYQGNGPYKIVEWELNSHVIVEPNPLYNLPRGNLERVVSWFAGRPLEAYQSEEVDFSVIGSSIADVYFAKRHPVLRNEFVWTPTSGLCFLGFMFSENPVFWDARVRRAVAMAFDEATIVEAIYLGTQVPMRMMSDAVARRCPTVATVVCIASLVEVRSLKRSANATRPSRITTHNPRTRRPARDCCLIESCISVIASFWRADSCCRSSVRRFNCTRASSSALDETRTSRSCD